MQIYATRDDSMPMIEGDPVQCIRGIWAHLSPEQKAQVRAELLPRRGSVGHALQVARIEQAREELGLPALRVFDPEAGADEPYRHRTPGLHSLTEYVIDETGELLRDDEPIPFALAPDDDRDDDDRDDDGDTVPEPTPLVPFGAAAEPVAAG